MVKQGTGSHLVIAKPENERDALVTQYMPLVHYVVNTLTFTLPPMLDSDDLVSYGTMGLINAIDRYDVERGVKFETYAVTRIRGYIIDQLRALDWIPRSTRQRTRQLERIREEMEHELGRNPTADEVANKAGLDRRKYDQAVQNGSCITVSLDAKLYSDNDSEASVLLHLVRDDSSSNPTSTLEENEIKAAIKSALSVLSERERQLLHLYYFEDQTLQEISHILHVSESRVCQLHSQALKRLRTVIAA